MDGETAEVFESFDDAPDDGAFESFDDGFTVEEDETEEKPTLKKAIEALDASEADSEGKVIKKEGKSEKPQKEEESFDDEEEEEESEEEEDIKVAKKEEEESEESDKPKSKLRMRMGDELFNVESDATFKVKIDGKLEDVGVQELINNYSGKTAWDKKFTEIGKEKKILESEKVHLTSQKNNLIEHVNKALGPIKDKDANPLDSLLYLVEMSGEDPYSAYRRIMEANLEELSSLMDMGETERDLYFHKKKDELHGKVAKQRYEKQQETESFNQIQSKVDSLRQAHNVSEDEFVDASEELEASFKASGLDPNSVKVEDVVDFASLKPHIAVVRELIEPYEDNISEGKYGDVVAELSRFLRDGKGDKTSVQEILKRNFSVEEDVKDLNTKIYQKQALKSGKKVALKEEDSNGFESFDDDY